MKATGTRTLALATFLMLLAAPVPAAEPEPRVTVVVSHEHGSYVETVTGVTEALNAGRPAADLSEIRLGGDPARALGLGGEARESALVVAIGALATEQVFAQVVEADIPVPVVSCLVLRSDASFDGRAVTGVLLDHEADAQLDLLTRVFPSARAVGVLYNLAENARTLEVARAAAIRRGLRLVERQVSSPRDIPNALASLQSQADVIWGLPDTLVYSPQTAKNILLFSFRNRIPLFGPSPKWAEAGAMCAPDWDYRDLGLQCGELGLRLLDGAAVADAPPELPRQVRYVLNARTADQMKLEIDPVVLKGASRVY